jgi:hypothetical protein
MAATTVDGSQVDEVMDDMCAIITLVSSEGKRQFQVASLHNLFIRMFRLMQYAISQKKD